MKTLKRKQLPLYALAGFGLNLLNTIFAIYLTDALIGTGFIVNKQYWTFAGTTIVEMAIFTVLITLGKIFDGVVDVPLAGLVDKIHTKWGKRRPAILIGTILTILFYVGLCFPLERVANSVPNAIWIGVLTFFFFGAYTLTYVTYYGTFSEVTDNSEDRIYLSNWKSFIDTIQYAIAYALIPVFVGLEINIQYIALAVAPLGLTMLFAIFLIKERSTRKEDVAKYKKEHPNEPETKISDEVGIWESIKYTFKNKNFVLWLVLLAVFYFGLQMFLSGQNVLASGPMGLNGWQTAIINTAAFAPVPLMLYFYKKIMKRKGFRFAFQIALMSFAMAMVCFSFAYIKWLPSDMSVVLNEATGHKDVVLASGTNTYLRLIIGALGGTFGSFGIGAFFMAPYMIPAQAAAEDKEKNKISHAPMFFAVQGLVTAGFGALSTGLLWPNLRNNFDASMLNKTAEEMAIYLDNLTDSERIAHTYKSVVGTHIMPYVVIGTCLIAFIICFFLPKSFDQLGKGETEVRHCKHCNKDVHVKMEKYQVVILIILILMGLIPGILYGVFYPRRCPECKKVTKKNPVKMYCPKCKKEVVSKMTSTQIILTIVLFVAGIVPGILYLMFYKKKCSVCETTLEPVKKGVSKTTLKPATKRKK